MHVSSRRHAFFKKAFGRGPAERAVTGAIALSGSLLLALGASSAVIAQTPPTQAAATARAPAPAPAESDNCLPKGFIPAPPTYKAVEQLPDRRVTFKVCAPDATAVRLISNDIPDVIPMGLDGRPAGLAMTKGDKGVWSVTTPAPIAPDTYRFNFSVDGAPVPNPQGTTFSETLVGLTGTFEVLGPEGAFQTYNKDIPHGAVAEVEYWSRSLGGKRRAHVYTPPGYMRGTARYPVLYLVHGAGDSDDSWTSIGRAHHVLDNLIAAGKAKPMIIVMPAGHTPPRQDAGGAGGGDILVNADFSDDLLKDLLPYIDANYRTIDKPESRAMAGLSMGGAHTLNTGLPHPELFGYTGIFSMGLLNAEQLANYEARNGAALDRAAKSMKLVYYAMGKADFLYASVAPTRNLFDQHGIRYIYNESEGGHTWINWRRYLNDFAPRLFR